MIGFWFIQSIFLFGLSTLAAKIILPQSDPVALYYFIEYAIQWAVWIAFSLYMFRRSMVSYDPGRVWKAGWFLMHLGIFIIVLLVSFSVEYLYRIFIDLAGLGPGIDAGELAGMYLLQIGTFLMKYFFIVGFSQAVCYISYIKDRELESARFEKEQARLQYQLLSMQIKPHFIFNAQHTIHSLIEVGDNKTASAMLMKLSTLMRNVISYSDRDTISIEEEIGNLKNYIELQQIRFGEDIAVHIAMDETAGPVQIPALSLQPIVENCYQHAFGELATGRIQITVAVDAGMVNISVQDNGKGFDTTGVKSTSYGLRNIKDRIRNLYGNDGRMEIQSTVNKGTTVVFTIPFIYNH